MDVLLVAKALSAIIAVVSTNVAAMLLKNTHRILMRILLVRTWFVTKEYQLYSQTYPLSLAITGQFHAQHFVSL